MSKPNFLKTLHNYNYNFFHIETTDSTMNDARNFLVENKKNCVFISDKQTPGRGRRGNIWHSPVGNIYCSITFANFLQTKNLFLFNVLIAVSIKMSLEKFNANKIYFKWPNDIFYESKKFAGIISEIIDIDKKNSHIIIGFGINVISSPKIKNYHSTYLKYFSDVTSKEEFLPIFFENLFLNIEELKKGKINKLMDFFSSSLMFLNKEIKIISSKIPINIGIFKGINEDGSLQLDKNGTIENIYNGSIEL